MEDVASVLESSAELSSVDGEPKRLVAGADVDEGVLYDWRLLYHYVVLSVTNIIIELARTAN